MANEDLKETALLPTLVIFRGKHVLQVLDCRSLSVQMDGDDGKNKVPVPSSTSKKSVLLQFIKLYKISGNTHRLW